MVSFQTHILLSRSHLIRPLSPAVQGFLLVPVDPVSVRLTHCSFPEGPGCKILESGALW